MSTRTNLKTGWTMPAVDEQTAFWGTAAYKLPPFGTPGNDVLRGDNGLNGIYGGPGRDTIYGLGGQDALAGGTGNDKLYGGKGQDNFIFDTKPNTTTNIDKIMDFKAVDDMISLASRHYKKISVGGLKEEAFHLGKKAHDADDRIIYDKGTGSLYYDPDGTGSAARIKFAVLANKATISHIDIVIG
jgi:Ca2+-binding RTX toxin-like protein